MIVAVVAVIAFMVGMFYLVRWVFRLVRDSLYAAAILSKRLEDEVKEEAAKKAAKREKEG